MPKDFESLVDELKFLKEAEEEAEKIVEKGEKEADRIVREAEEESAAIISRTEGKIREAARGIRREVDSEVSSEVDDLEEEFMANLKELRNKKAENLEEAISYIYQQVLKIEG